MKLFLQEMIDTAAAGDVMGWILIGALLGLAVLLVITGFFLWDQLEEWRESRAEERWQARRRAHVARLREQERLVQEERGLLERAEARRGRLEWRSLGAEAGGSEFRNFGVSAGDN